MLKFKSEEETQVGEIQSYIRYSERLQIKK